MFILLYFFIGNIYLSNKKTLPIMHDISLHEITYFTFTHNIKNVNQGRFNK